MRTGNPGGEDPWVSRVVWGAAGPNTRKILVTRQNFKTSTHICHQVKILNREIRICRVSQRTWLDSWNWAEFLASGRKRFQQQVLRHKWSCQPKKEQHPTQASLLTRSARIECLSTRSVEAESLVEHGDVVVDSLGHTESVIRCMHLRWAEACGCDDNCQQAPSRRIT